MERSKTRTTVWVVEQGMARSRADQLATEEPLEIRLAESRRVIAITMRTPGADLELAAGFLYSEGIIQQRQDIRRISYCIDPSVDGKQRYNTLNVELREDLVPNLQPLERHFYTTSACGICGKTSLESLKIRCDKISAADPIVPATVLYSLSEQLQTAQGIFRATGGLHAAALFSAEGKLLMLQEDVGRHNALDKLIGAALLTGELPLANHIVMVSGRASFEIMQKCLAARVGIVCSVSAPSSLAVALAREFDMTLVGFLRGERFNIYAGKERIALEA
ncbi:MAG: formate dehydrogenase accessory sulfurtransferase FdhD [Leptolyngbyaceae cyanobacterium HOT.MB2.61]|jgi:FdhD protein|nr:formate dehydrogenase accessory sulfurtransferase FdhD [Leptolyngbyaceae cyanobacterium HOT.MB2.61]